MSTFWWEEIHSTDFKCLALLKGNVDLIKRPPFFEVRDLKRT